MMKKYLLFGALTFLAGLYGCTGYVPIDQLINQLNTDISDREPNIVVQLVDETRIENGTGQYNFAPVMNDNTPGGFASDPVTFRIYNKGGFKSTLSISSVTLSGGNSSDFNLSNFQEVALDFDEYTSFTITFDPAHTGNLSTTVTISCNDPDTSSYTFSAIGVGQDSLVPLVSVLGTSSFTIGWVGVSDNTLTIPGITTFMMGRHEVTWKEWSAVKLWAESSGLGYVFESAGSKGDNNDRTENDPVTNMTWRDAIVWCNAASELSELTPCYYTDNTLSTVYRNASTGTMIGNDCVILTHKGFRLPTEAEWEYAARYGSSVPTDGNLVSGASTTDSPDLFAVISTSATAGTQPVQGKQPNALGVYDMSGNAEEWCWDLFASNTFPSTATSDYMGATTGSTDRVIRGGRCNQAVTYAQTSFRQNTYWAYNEGFSRLGFRVVRRP